MDAVAVLFPVDCAGCGAPDRAVCGQCRRALRATRPLWAELSAPAGLLSPSAVTPTLRMWAAREYTPELASCLRAYKDHNRPGLARVLAPILAEALREAERALGVELTSSAQRRLIFLAAPSARRAVRQRGYRPVELLLRRSRTRLRSGGRFTLVRHVRDQTELSAEHRLRNVRGAVRAPKMMRDTPVILVDDVVTTGSTIFECARAVARSGGQVVGVVSLAYAPRRHKRKNEDATSNAGD